MADCTKCGSFDNPVVEGPDWSDENEIQVHCKCKDCGHAWTGVYSLPERIGVQDEEDHELPEYDDSEDIQ